MSKKGTYRVLIKHSAEGEMNRLPERTLHRVSRAILNLEGDPRPSESKKLRGQEDYRIRVGQYRILYSIDDRSRTIEIVAVGHRRDVYRNS